jgi:hypothetical protein
MKKLALILLCACLGVVLVLDSAGIVAAVSRTMSLCLNTIIPSLFAFLALSTFVVSAGLVKGEIAIFALSLVGGYPVGAKLLAERSAKGMLKGTSKSTSCAKRAEYMLMYCYCASPAFLIAIAGRLGVYVWLSNALACLIFAAVANIINRSRAMPPQTTANKTRQLKMSAILVNSVASAGSALYRICLMMLIFAVLLRILEFIGIMALLPDYAYAVLEITRVSDLNVPPSAIAALTSFGGVCVLFQTAAIVGSRLKLRRFMLARIPIAALSAGICHILTANMVDTAVETAADVSRRHVLITEAGSPLASVCLLIMTLFLIASDCETLGGNAL